MAELRSELKRLYQDVQKPTYKDLGARADRLGLELPTSTITDLLTSRRLARWKSIRTFVEACRAEAGARKLPLAADRFDIAWWQSRYDAPRPGVRPPSLDAQEAIRGEREVESRYIPRMPLEERLRTAVELYSLVLVIGEGGAGKTTLVKEFIRHRASQGSVFFLDCASRSSLAFSIRRELRRFGVDHSRLADSALTFAVRDFLECHGRAIGFLVLDNVEEWGIIVPFASPALPQKTLMTARRDYGDKVVRVRGTSLVVGSMASTEAEAMMNSLLPGISLEEIEYLRVLSGRPLAIQHVCGFLKERSLPERRRFLEILGAHLPVGLGMASSALDEEGFKAIYRSIVNRLGAEESPHSLRLLELCAFARNDLWDTFLSKAIGIACHSGKPGLTAELFESARTTLSRYLLIDLDEDAELEDEGISRPRFSMHDVTRAVLCELFENVAMERRSQLIAAIEEEEPNLLRDYHEATELADHWCTINMDLGEALLPVYSHDLDLLRQFRKELNQLLSETALGWICLAR
jgi:hypothetical protein